MLQISLQMLWKERKSFKSWNYNYNNFMCMYYFLQFFNNPIINYLVNILKDTTKVYGYEAITEYEVMRFYDGMYKRDNGHYFISDFYFINNVFL